MSDRRLPRTLADVIGLWATPAECARAMGPHIKEHQPRDWARRGSLPSEHIAPLVKAARKAGHKHITNDLVVSICAKKRAA